MQRKVNYSAVGAFVLLLAAALIYIGLWLAAKHSHQQQSPYLVVMHEAVAGLSTDAPVKFNGVTVGYVHNIQLNPNNSQEVQLLLYINSNTPITTSTVASLKAQGITGLTYVGLKSESANGDPLVPTREHPYPIIRSEPSLLVQLNTVLREATEDLRQISNRVNALLSEDNVNSLQQTLNNISTITNSFAKNSKHVDHVIQHLDVVLKQMQKATKQAPELMQQSQKTLKNIDGLILSVKKISLDIKSQLSSVLPQSSQLIQRLNATATNLQGLSAELKKQPSILLRGKQQQKLGPGEK